MSILMIEVGRSEGLGPFDDWVQLAQVVLDRRGVYRPFKGNPPSLGWGNIQPGLFNEVKSNHPELAGIEHEDLIWDDNAAIRVTAFTLADLILEIEETAPADLRRRYSTRELAAAAYNVGLDTVKDVYYQTGKKMGTYGADYGAAMTRRYERTIVFCDSGVWTC